MSLFRRRAPKPQAEPQARPQPDFAGEVPVVNGVQASLNWAVPYTNNDNNYHMPPGEYTEKTKENFFKVLKNEFNIDFEANWRDAVSRFVVTNPTTKDFLERYAANMEEYEIMPHCQEKYQLMEKEANELKMALVYELAKGGIAAFKPGESQPRQIRCDKDPNVMVVTEPLEDCFVGNIAAKYRKGFEPRPVPPTPKVPDVPKPFTEPEPKAPDDPKPVTAVYPGECPKENRIKKRPEDLQPVADILEGTTRDAMVDALYKEKLAEATKGLYKPDDVDEVPELEEEDPGEFLMKKPHDIKVPDKPATYDLYLKMQADAESIDTRLDSKYYMIPIYKRGEFDIKEPKRPQVDEPELAIPPELVPEPEGKPRPKYMFDEPKLKLIKPEGLEEPVLDLSDLDEPEYPELREEPPRPSGFTRFLGFFSSSVRARVRDYDSWVTERDTLEERRAKYEEDIEVFEKKKQSRIEHYEKQMAEFKDKIKAYAETYDGELDYIGTENEMLQVQYDMEKSMYMQDLAKLGGKSFVKAKEKLDADPDNPKLREAYESELAKAKSKLHDQKLEYERAVKEWEDKHPELAGIRAENAKRQEAYEKDYTRQKLEEAEYKRNFSGCVSPEDHEKRKEQLLAGYEEDLKYYNDSKKRYESDIKTYEEQVEKCREHAKAHGIDPDEAVAANEDRVRRQRQYDKANEELSTFLQHHPEIMEYEHLQDEYKEEEEYRELYNERLESWKQEKEDYETAKKIYDQKVEARKNFEQAKENYDKKFKEISTDVLLASRKEVDEKIRKNREERETFAARNAENKHEQEVWDSDNERVKENNRKMHEPGGLIYNWKEKVKAYENDVLRYNREVTEYKKAIDTLPERRQQWKMRKDAHEQEVNEYGVKKQLYDEKIKEIKEIREANELGELGQTNADLKDPLYRDYVKHANPVGYNHWSSQMKNSYKMMNRQGVDLSKEGQQIKDASKAYYKNKSSAPKNPSAKAQKEYQDLVIQRNKQKAEEQKKGPEKGGYNL